MNRFKEDALKELQHIKLSPQRKQQMADKARHAKQRQAGNQWSYRLVLAAFTILALGFSYLIMQKGQQPLGQQTASSADTWSLWSLWASDIVRGLCVLGLYMGLGYFVKYVLRKKGYGLPVCIACGESWSKKEARQLHRKNDNIICPSCGKKQYRTKKSIQASGVVSIPVSFIVLAPHIFQNFWLGIPISLIGMWLFYRQVAPYTFKLQDKDSVNEPLW